MILIGQPVQVVDFRNMPKTEHDLQLDWDCGSLAEKKIHAFINMFCTSLLLHQYFSTHLMQMDECTKNFMNAKHKSLQ